MIKTTTKQPKAVEFFEILRRIVIDRYGHYGEYLLDISYLDTYVKDKKESINVYEDVRKMVKKELESLKSPKNQAVLKNIDKLAELRIAYLKGEDTTKLTYEDAKKYIRNFNNYPEIFTDKTIKTAVANRKLKEFASIETFFGYSIESMRNKGYLELSSGIRKRKERNGRWEREVEDEGTEFLVPDQYQLKESIFLTDCLYIEYPYLKKYHITVYHLGGTSYKDFYVKVKDSRGNDKGSLYIPFKALKERNPQLAIDRMNSYFTSYYGKDKENLQKQLSLMKTKIAKELFKDIKTGGVSQ